MIFVLAQTHTDWTGTLLQVGVAGVMLAWFMWRDNESRKAEATRRIEDAARAKEDALQIKGVENAIDRMARANLILVLSLKQADATAKGEAQKIIDQIDEHLK